MAVDSLWSSVGMLLPLSADLLDVKGKVITANGGAALSSAVGTPFAAGSACHFDGTGDYLSTPVHADFSFGTGSGTIEAWVYIAASSTADNGGTGNKRAVIMSTQAGADTTYWAFVIDGNGSTTGTGLFLDTSLSSVGQVKSATVSISQSAWHHIVVSWNGAGTYFGVDGTIYSTTAFTQAINCGTAPRIAGQNVTNWARELNGYVAQVRVTKGSARYTSNYTIPSAPFPRPMISGVTYAAGGSPASKVVAAFKRSTLALDGYAVSNGGTGAYTIYPSDFSEHIALEFDTATYPLVDGGSGENALIYDRVIPGG